MDTETRGDTLMDRTAQIAPLGDLIKLTGIATVVFLLLFFLYIFVPAGKDNQLGQMLSRSDFVLVLMFALILGPIVFCQFLPWMERYGLNSLSGSKHILWTALAAFFAFVLLLAINAILSYMPVLTPEYWILNHSYSGSSIFLVIGIRLMQVLITLFYMAEAYAVWWCSFTLVQKLRGFAALPDSSVAAQERAALVTRWSFILTYSIWIAAAIGILTFFFGLFGFMSYRGGAPSLLSMLFIVLCVYVVAFFLAAVLIHAFTANWMPERMMQVQPEKLLFSFALISVFMFLVATLCNLLAQWIEISKNNVFAIIMMVIFFIAAIVMCKKVLVDYIRTVWVRVLASVLIFLPTLLLAIKGANDIVSFFLLFGLIFSLITFSLFLVGYSIKLVLRIVYGEPDNVKDAWEHV